jgi:acyl-CoA thioester hydrolase
LPNPTTKSKNSWKTRSRKCKPDPDDTAMLKYRTEYRVIYGDTDRMGVAYYGHYLRWFEIGRTELIRSWGLSYKSLEDGGVFLPVSEVHCKFLSSARYDDVLTIETSLDAGLRAGMKFDYEIFKAEDAKLLATGYTIHAFVDESGRVIRPPKFLRELAKERNTKFEGES